MKKVFVTEESYEDVRESGAVDRAAKFNITVIGNDLETFWICNNLEFLDFYMGELDPEECLDFSTEFNEGLYDSTLSPVEVLLRCYEPWQGAVPTWETIKNNGKIGMLETVLEDLYPDGMPLGEFNDLLWFEEDTVYEWVGIEPEK